MSHRRLSYFSVLFSLIISSSAFAQSVPVTTKPALPQAIPLHLRNFHMLWDMAVQEDGKIILIGSNKMIRMHPDLSLDAGFGNQGTVSLAGFVNDLELLSDGKIAVLSTSASSTSSPQLLRFLSNGQLDSGFSQDGSLAMQCENPASLYVGPKLSVRGTDMVVAVSPGDQGEEKFVNFTRIGEAGNSYDPCSNAFSCGPGDISDMAWNDQGALWATIPVTSGTAQLVRMKWDAENQLQQDPTFEFENLHLESLNKILPRSDGKTWVVSDRQHLDGQGWWVYLLNEDGSLPKDNNIMSLRGPRGSIYRAHGKNAVLVLKSPQDDLIVFESPNPQVMDLSAVRIRKDGKVDTSFQMPFSVQDIRTLFGAMTSDGRIILAYQARHEDSPITVTGFRVSPTK